MYSNAIIIYRYTNPTLNHLPIHSLCCVASAAVATSGSIRIKSIIHLIETHPLAEEILRQRIFASIRDKPSSILIVSHINLSTIEGVTFDPMPRSLATTKVKRTTSSVLEPILFSCMADLVCQFFRKKGSNYDTYSKEKKSLKDLRIVKNKWEGVLKVVLNIYPQYDRYVLRIRTMWQYCGSFLVSGWWYVSHIYPIENTYKENYVKDVKNILDELDTATGIYFPRPCRPRRSWWEPNIVVLVIIAIISRRWRLVIWSRSIVVVIIVVTAAPGHVFADPWLSPQVIISHVSFDRSIDRSPLLAITALARTLWVWDDHQTLYYYSWWRWCGWRSNGFRECNL